MVYGNPYAIKRDILLISLPDSRYLLNPLISLLIPLNFRIKNKLFSIKVTFKHLQKHTNKTQKMIELNFEGIKFTIETKENLYKHETNNFLKELPDIKNNDKFTVALFILNRWAKSMSNF